MGKDFAKVNDRNILCRRNGSLEEIRIKNQSFLLVVLLSGELGFYEEECCILAEAPCCICFNEKENPKFRETGTGAEYFCLYFRPDFLDADLTFEAVRTSSFENMPQVHEVFLLIPFLEPGRIVPLDTEALRTVGRACADLNGEMAKERDYYWYCRCRSYLMEILIGLERAARITEKMSAEDATIWIIRDKKLKGVVKYIQDHYREKIKLKDIAANCGMNPVTLTTLMERETGMTTMEYLKHYRIRMAKELLLSSELSVKEISAASGFSTEAHFCRVFKERHGRTPEEFRRRKREIRKQKQL